MTPDRFDLTVAALAGQVLPRLPDLPGRLHLAHDDELTAGERLELLLSPASHAEVGRCLGLTRQRVHQLRAGLHRHATAQDEDHR